MKIGRFRIKLNLYCFDVFLSRRNTPCEPKTKIGGIRLLKLWQERLLFFSDSDSSSNAWKLELFSSSSTSSLCISSARYSNCHSTDDRQALNVFWIYLTAIILNWEQKLLDRDISRHITFLGIRVRMHTVHEIYTTHSANGLMVNSKIRRKNYAFHE